MTKFFKAKTVEPSFVPSSLFTGGIQGGHYEIALANLFQDSAGTTPVTTTGQQCGRIVDLSGNNNHLLSSGGARPTLQQDSNGIYYLQMDGVDDNPVSSATFTLSKDKFFCMAISHDSGSDSNAGLNLMLYKNTTNYLGVGHRQSNGTGRGYCRMDAQGVTANVNVSGVITHSVDQKFIVSNQIISGQYDVKSGLNAAVTQATSLTTQTDTGGTIQIRARTGVPYRFYGGTACFKVLSATERNNIIFYHSHKVKASHYS